MEYNNTYNKPYCGISQPTIPAAAAAVPGSSGFFPANDTAPSPFLKVPNPPYIKQETVPVGGESVIPGGTVTPPVNYSQDHHHYGTAGSYGEPGDVEKPPLFYRKAFDMPYMATPYVQSHLAQQFPQHLPSHPNQLPPHQHHAVHSQPVPHFQHQQQQQQLLHHHQQPLAPLPTIVPSDMHSPQQLGPEQLQRAQPQQQQQQQQHPSSFHDYFDHLDPSSLEPYAYVLQKPAPPVPPIQPSETGSPLPASYPTASPVAPPAATPSPYTPLCEPPDSSKVRFKCETCPKSFDTKQKLEKHNRIHQPNGGGAAGLEFKCRMCDKTFRTKSTLICHEKVHGESGLGSSCSCVECGKVFATEEKLQVHRRLHTGEKPYQCKVCLKCFNHQSNLIVHARIHDKVKQALKCARCSKVLDSEERLAVHMRLHTGEKPYKCSYCDKRFNHKSTVSTHEKAAHIAANSYRCGRCHKTFNQKCQLQYHEKLQEEHTIACEHCEKVFCYKASHKEHLFKVHFPRPKKKAQRKGGSLREGDEQQQQESGTGGAMAGSNEGGNQGRNKFKCTVCDRRFYYERALEMHMGVHDASLDVNVLYFSCDYCPETFTEEETLQQHEARHVADGTTDFRANMKRAEEGGNATTGHRCPLCFKQFEDEPSLREHHRSHLCPFPDCARCDPVRRDDAFDLTRSTYDPADDTQPTVCNVCHRVLPTFEAYQNHFHYHTSRVPFYCYHCREEFNDKRELYNHTRTHAPRAPESYTCEVCAKVFSTKGNFKRHLKSHEAVRAFACDRCSKQYDYKSALEVHLKRSHGIEL
uniref:C2H2-type domain-containing protein n=1 Tax=Anopheles gambiae TaxID=7165 RepID=A0A1S4GZK5_ANOGA